MKKNVIQSSETRYSSQRSALDSLKSERKSLKESIYTLTRLLHELQSIEVWPKSKPIFEKLGLPTSRKLGKNALLSMLPASSFVTIKVNGKEEKVPAITARRKVFTTDENGNRVYTLDKNGEFVYNYYMAPVKNGTWNVDKFIQLCESIKNA